MGLQMVNDTALEKQFNTWSRELSATMTRLVHLRATCPDEDRATYRYLARRVEAMLTEVDFAQRRIENSKTLTAISIADRANEVLKKIANKS